jgi:hypothetical protein
MLPTAMWHSNVKEEFLGQAQMAARHDKKCHCNTPTNSSNWRRLEVQRRKKLTHVILLFESTFTYLYSTPPCLGTGISAFHSGNCGQTHDDEDILALSDHVL